MSVHGFGEAVADEDRATRLAQDRQARLLVHEGGRSSEPRLRLAQPARDAIGASGPLGAGKAKPLAQLQR